jgi:hypothetical protein
MGCHTWFHKKINVTYEQAKKFLIKIYKNEITLYQTWIDNPNDEYYVDLLEDYPEYDINYCIKQCDIIKRKLRLVEGGYCKEAVMNKYDRGIANHVTYVKGKGHYQSLDWCDTFRIPGYPEDILFSLEETLDFIEKNKSLIYYYHQNDVTGKDWKEQLEEYWKEYPDGMIDFG